MQWGTPFFELAIGLIWLPVLAAPGYWPVSGLSPAKDSLIMANSCYENEQLQMPGSPGHF